MCNGIRACIASTLFALLLVAPATSQETTADPLAYTLTGDALWDTYAQALLDHLDSVPYGSGSWGLPNELLDSWEDEFGDNPRYWQLRYWNVIQQAGFGGSGNIAAIEYLEYSTEIGASDAVTEMLLYKYREDSLQDFWDQFPSKTPEQKAAFGMPDIPPGHGSRMWFTKREAQLRDNLVADCPDESWAWYTSAMKRFDYGDWKAGLDDMRRGNNAPRNRVPLPFPASFVVSRMANEQDCGSEVAAGILVEGVFAQTLPNFINLKDHVKNQEIRLSMGAPISELEPWHSYTCRFGSMDGASAIQWLVAVVLRGIQIQYLLVEAAESFSVEQRGALWALHGRTRKIRELVQYEMKSEQPDWDDMNWELKTILLRYGVTTDPAELMPFDVTLELPDFGLEPDKQAPLYAELEVIFYTYYYRHMEAEYGTIYRKAKERFEMLATFDFETFSWPEK